MQIGIVLPHLGPSQLAYYAAKSIQKSPKYNFVLFYEDIMPVCLKPNCAIMHSTELWGFDGLVITASITSTLHAINAINNSKILYYVWNIHELKNNNFIDNMKIIHHSNVKLATRSNHYKDLVENYCSKSVDLIFDNFKVDYGQVQRLYN